MEFETNGPCSVCVYEYREKKQFIHGHKGALLYTECVTGISVNGNQIENIHGLTDYDFRKYLSQMIDSVFDSMKMSHENIVAKVVEAG